MKFRWLWGAVVYWLFCIMVLEVISLFVLKDEFFHKVTIVLIEIKPLVPESMAFLINPYVYWGCCICGIVGGIIWSNWDEIKGNPTI